MGVVFIYFLSISTTTVHAVAVCAGTAEERWWRVEKAEPVTETGQQQHDLTEYKYV